VVRLQVPRQMQHKIERYFSSTVSVRPGEKKKVRTARSVVGLHMSYFTDMHLNSSHSAFVINLALLTSVIRDSLLNDSINRTNYARRNIHFCAFVPDDAAW